MGLKRRQAARIGSGEKPAARKAIAEAAAPAAAATTAPIGAPDNGVSGLGIVAGKVEGFLDQPVESVREVESDAGSHIVTNCHINTLPMRNQDIELFTIARRMIASLGVR